MHSDSSEYITAQLYADNKPLSQPMRTSYKQVQMQKTWNEWIVFPIKYRDLPRNCVISFTVWDAYGPRRAIPIGGTTVEVFGGAGTLRKGKHKLVIWPWVSADGSVATSTPGKSEDSWMDKLERLMRKYERGDIPHIEWLDYISFREIERVSQAETASTKKLYLYVDFPQFDFPLVVSQKEYAVASTLLLPRLSQSTYIVLSDSETLRDNPVENKHRRLARSHRNGPLDRDLKPTAKIRDELNVLLKYPPTKPLSTEEKDLLWKFRFYLTRDKKALTKFLKCVIWSDPVEERQAVEILSSWVDIDIEDALELLGLGFQNPNVRGFAVDQLKKADDEELLLYLLQLVQALRFEGMDEKFNVQDSPLATFLIGRSVQSSVLGNYFYWYIMVECEDKVVGKLFAKIAYHFMAEMVEISEGPHRRDILRRQAELIAILSKISKDIRSSKESRPRKIERLRTIIQDPKNGLLSFPPLPLPLDAQIEVTGIIPASVFKSALSPLRITFTCIDGSEYPVIFKTGDDMRQDQLVVQIITLMDKLLRKENLDLKLTPYKVLATGPDHGIVQFIPSQAIATILSEHSNNLVGYLRESGVREGGVPPAALDTYVKSLAGYCVITYLLGIGDRHLDNLLLTTTGNLFHIDFGFILGRDPKPFPPPMKLSKEMVDVMGGTSSQTYQKFKTFCFVAYNSLRKSANLILNLFSLMVSANVPDIAIEPDKAVLKVQEKFRLDLNEEEAIQHLQNVINESVGAMFPQVMERIHQVAQSEYDRGVNTFSPEGRLFQVEYAIEAIKLGSTAVGIQTSSGVVLGVEKRITSPLLEADSIEKILEIDSHLGCAMSGLVADWRTLVDHARVEAQNHRFTFDEKLKVESLTQAVCDLALRFGESADGEDAIMSRPFGVALLIGGVDEHGPQLFHADPSGTFTRFDAKAIGSGSEGAQTELQEQYHRSLSLRDAELLALKVLKQVMEEKLNATNVQIATITAETGFRILPNAELTELVAAMQ
ncbi:Phosphatidylinositol (PI) 3-kinase [Phlyctochytrium planicorne]|nr:Phosphatidylinositol (PI) 3-kinase [Phlyctochytrium planicorne]